MTDCKILQRRGNWWEDAQWGNCHFPIGPWNTWSNAGYLLVGLYVYGIQGTPSSAVFCATMLFLGVGSFLYHGTKELWSATLDDAGMYAVFLGLLLHGLWLPWFLVLPLTAVGTWYLGWKRPERLIERMGVVVGALTLLGAAHGHFVRLGASLALFAVAYGLWQLDQRRKWVGKYGHASWHILTALAIGLLYGAVS